MALADYSGMGAIEGYELAKRSNNAQSLAALQGASGVLGLRRSLQDEQENQAIKAVLSSGEEITINICANKYLEIIICDYINYLTDDRCIQ